MTNETQFMQENSKPLTICIAGASGYIGNELIKKLLERFSQAQIIALSRTSRSSSNPRVQWQTADLFSKTSIEKALPEKIDIVFYLVHSMGPTAQLDQGSFADYDLLLADNFCRAIKSKSPRQLIYLGGLLPPNERASLHLESRAEVEQIFFEHEIPTTVLRAGLVLGEWGSSSQILFKLVQRLPVMVLPKWTQTLTTPIDLDNVMEALQVVTNQEKHFNKIYDLASSQPITYAEIMRETAKSMGLRRFFFKVPFFSPKLSRLWVSLVTGTPKNLVYPLIESLEHPMVARTDHLLFPELIKNSYSSILNKTQLKTNRTPFRFRIKRKTVRSVQRIKILKGQSAPWVMEQYIGWLPRFLKPLILVKKIDNRVCFCLFSEKLILLELTFNQSQSDDCRQLLMITGGLLVAKENQGRLEFRKVLKGRFVLAAIHDFKPALPWFLYKITQAQLHLFVMNSFTGYLAKKNQIQ